MNELELFSAALELADPTDRARLLDEACDGHPEVRSRIDALLRNASDASRYLESPPHALLATLDQSPSEPVGTLIGPYKLLEQIGEGGMGLVYMAEQQRPMRRLVALKLIKPGMDSKQVIARFEAEKQPLAMMDHENIAKVLDAGTTETGRPYFVMELVRGIPINQLCDEKRLAVRQRLELFIQVCQAVQHAHLKGIIHRDLKPTNVLVTMHDSVPVPKVIDFGIAKALGQQLTDHTLHTGFAQLVGTPLYMSPEQAEMNQLGVDTRSDVYSLGVLLYELLTGQTPFDKDTLSKAGFDEMRRIIREQEPPRPSARLSTLEANTLSTVSQRRSTDPRRISATLRGELDWIVMKALEKDRNHRYESASSFAADVQRYLDDEPVQACPPSAGYRFRKFARRNKATLTTAAVVAAMLILGTTVSTWQAFRATQAKAQAKAEEQRALAAATAERAAKQAEADQRQKAEANERDAKQAVADANAILEFFEETVLLTGRPQGLSGALGKDVTLRQAVDAAAAQISKKFHDRPLVEASIRDVLGTTYLDLGEPLRAIEQHRIAHELRHQFLGADAEDTLVSLCKLGLDYNEAHQAKEGLPLLSEGLKMAKARYGNGDNLALLLMNQLAAAYCNVGRFKESIELYEQALALRRAKFGSDDPELFSLMHNLGQVYKSDVQIKKAIPLFKQAYDFANARFPPDDQRSITALRDLAESYFWNKQWAEAEPLLVEVLQKQRKTLGSDHPDTITTVTQLATTYFWPNGRPEAIPLFAEAYQWYRSCLGVDHAVTAHRADELIIACKTSGRSADALGPVEELLSAQTARLAEGDRRLIGTITEVAKTNRAAGNAKTALTLGYGALQLARRKSGIYHTPAFALPRIEQLVAPLKVAGKLEEAAAITEYLIPPLEAEYEAKRSRRGATDAQMLKDLEALITTLTYAQDYERLERHSRTLLDKYSKAYGATDSRALRAQSWLGTALVGQQRFTEAEAILRACVAESMQREPDFWTTFKRRSLLGTALLGQAREAQRLDPAQAEPRLAAAEQELLTAYDGLKSRVGNAQFWLLEASQALVDLYTAWHKPDETAKWQAVLDALNRDQPK